jgi:hypothetical protein
MSSVAKCALLVAALMLLLAPAARAGEVVFSPQNNPPNSQDGWQAGTCSVSTCAPDDKPPSAFFFEKAAGHPPFGITQFIVRHKTELLHEEPEVDMKTLRVDLPVGLSVNPGATPQCSATHPSECASQAPLSLVGESLVTVSPELPLAPPVTVTAPVYNITPKPGESARFGFTVELPLISGIGVLPPSDVYLEGDVAWNSDYHEGFTIHVPKVEKVKLLKNRLVFNGQATAPGGTGFFLTTPSTCFDPTQPAFSHTYSTYARADSLQNPDSAFPNGSPFVEATLPPETSPKECTSIPFNPSLAAEPGTNQVDSPAAATTEVKLPVEADTVGQETSTMRTARVTLPAGMGLNPSAADGLVACTDAQFGRGTRNPVACPVASRVGTVSLATPALPEGPLTGGVFVGEQKSRDPESGEEFRIFVDAESPRYGVSVRLIGNVSANSRTGELTAVFDEPAKVDPLRGELPHGLPQVPFSAFKLRFDGGSTATLTSPPTCGPNTLTSQLTPWSAQFSGKPPATPSASFSLTSAPGGGACPKSMAERAFAPSFAAQPKEATARAFTPFSTFITRPSGQQELKDVDITLPPGATAKLKGVPYCKPSEIAAAVERAGAAEKKAPSCPDESKVGIATIASGSGPSPLKIDGTAYLAGPYKGAPLSLVVVTPALAGPFDLGTVVVRVALFLDPETAQIHAVSDPIPDVFGGAKLSLRSIFVNVNRKDFTLNGTNCRKNATSGVINGGGADPANPAAFSAFPVSDPFQGSGCKKLKFKPRLNLRLFGATSRAQHPKLKAVLKARPGDANIARASVGLPHALFLDQASLATICTRVQFAANACPKRSVYGHATAITPLLGKPLKGPVYLRSSNNPLPDLVAHLKGQVDIDLVGRIDSFKGGIRTTFGRVPDVPVKKFVMVIPGGKKGLLVASTNLCAKPVRGIVQLKAQNGRKANKRTTLRTPCGKKQKGKKSRAKSHQGGR